MLKVNLLLFNLKKTKNRIKRITKEIEKEKKRTYAGKIIKLNIINRKKEIVKKDIGRDVNNLLSISAILLKRKTCFLQPQTIELCIPFCVNIQVRKKRKEEFGKWLIYYIKKGETQNNWYHDKQKKKKDTGIWVPLH